MNLSRSSEPRYEVWIDQIPMGSGYGVELEPPAAELIYLGDRADTMWPQGYRHIWLTKWDGYAYKRVREIDPSAVVRVSDGERTWIYDQFRQP